MIRTFILSFLLVTFLCSYTQRKVLILGSSTSAFPTCFGPTNPANCYIERLKSFYGPLLIVDNRAATGFNVYRGMPKTYVPPPDRDQPRDYFNITDGLSTNPDVVLINYPSNGYDIFSVTEIMFCFRTIKKAANDAGKPCFITTTQPRSNFDDASRERMRIVKDSVLKEFGYYAIDFWKDLADPSNNKIATPYSVPSDPIHVNDEAHRILFERVVTKDIMNVFLPVTFMGFTTELKNNRVMVKWSTEKEKNVNKFLIQRGSGTSFVTIKELPAGGKDYSYVDEPMKGVNQYRIVSVDYDGKTLFSKTNQVYVEYNGITKLYSNQGRIYVELESKEDEVITIDLLNANGQNIQRSTHRNRSGNNRITINNSTLVNGIYLVRVTGKNYTEVKSLMY